jgi:DNA-binding transcriptional MerR regulator
MLIIDIARRLGVPYHTVYGWVKTFDEFLPAPETKGTGRDYGDSGMRVLQRIHDLKIQGHSTAQVRAALSKEYSMPATETYTLCESNNCGERALPGRRFCDLHRRLESMPQGKAAVVQVPANPETRAALLSVVKTAKDNPITNRGERPSWVASPERNFRRAVVGYWCQKCRQIIALHYKSCRCLADVEDPTFYAKFKARYWKDCFVEVSNA